MKITIETDHSPSTKTMHPSWDALQHVISTALADEEVIMVRISRDDKGIDYRAHGSYTVTLRDGATVKITSIKE